MVLPSALGVIPKITPDAVQTISLYEAAPVVRVAAPGRYAIYTNEQNVLERANMLEAAGASWMTVALTPTQPNAVATEVTGTAVLRGVRPYDPVQVRGRPILSFEISTAGDYVLSFAPQSGTVYFAPDITTNREGVILISAIAQVGLIILLVVLLRWPQIRRERQLHQQLARKLAERRAATQAFWREHEDADEGTQ